MARAVLGSTPRWAALVLAAALFGATAHGADQTGCLSKSPDRETHALQQRMTAGAFYKELQTLFGKPVTCRLDVQGGRTNLTYTFRHGAQLIAQTDPKIEFSEQRVEMVHMDPTKAIALLKQAELDAYRPDGCGISWTNGEEKSPANSGGTRETVFWGETCNCQARLIYKDDYVVILILRSAC